VLFVPEVVAISSGLDMDDRKIKQSREIKKE